MKPIKIRIRRKTLVRTKYQTNHKYRSDWILVGVIEYIDSVNIFKFVNGIGVCETEAQFAKLLYKNYRSGIYSCIAWVKGYSGFFGFWKGELSSDGFRRLPKNMTEEMKERQTNMLHFKKLKKQLLDDKIDSANKLKIKDKIAELKEEIGYNIEIIELENTNKHGPSGYLRANIPLYKMHQYEDYGQDKNVKEVAEVDFW